MYQNDRPREFARRLNKALDDIGAPTRGRARFINDRLPYRLSEVAIRKWLNGDAIPNTSRLSDIAAVAGASVESLIDLDSPYISSAPVNEPPAPFFSESVARVTLPTQQVPILSTVQAGYWAESLTYDQLGDDVEWQTTTANLTDGAFAVRVSGSSMTNPNGNPSLPDGSIAVVQPCPDPENGKIVVAMLSGSNEATIKRLEKDGACKHLVPLNPKFDPIPINGNCRIIGYVKEVIMRLD